MTPADYAYALISAGHTAQSAMIATGLSAERIAAIAPKSPRRIEFNPIVMRAPVARPVAVQYGPYIPAKTARTKMIIARVAAENGLTVDDIMVRSHARKYSWPRQNAMLAIRRETGLSYPAIGQIFKRDHATVMDACKKAEARERGK